MKFTLTWWQALIYEVSLFSLGILAGLKWGGFFINYTIIIWVIFVLTALYTIYLWLKEQKALPNFFDFLKKDFSIKDNSLFSKKMSLSELKAHLDRGFRKDIDKKVKENPVEEEITETLEEIASTNDQNSTT